MESKSEQLIKMVASRLKWITEPTKKDISDIIQLCYNEQMSIEIKSQQDFNKKKT